MTAQIVYGVDFRKHKDRTASESSTDFAAIESEIAQALWFGPERAMLGYHAPEKDPA